MLSRGCYSHPNTQVSADLWEALRMIGNSSVPQALHQAYPPELRHRVTYVIAP